MRMHLIAASLLLCLRGATGLHASAPAHSRLAASPSMMSELDLVPSVIRGAAVLPTMYALMSLNEYMTHRYFQHLEFNRPDSLLWLKAIIAKVTGDPVAPKVPEQATVPQKQSVTPDEKPMVAADISKPQAVETPQETEHSQISSKNTGKTKMLDPEFFRTAPET